MSVHVSLCEERAEDHIRTGVCGDSSWRKTEHPVNDKGVTMEDLVNMFEKKALPEKYDLLPKQSTEVEEMTSGLLASRSQESLMFKDSSVSFTEDEWGHFDSAQKGLYRDVMLENYRNLASMGHPVSKPDVISQLKHGKDPWTKKEIPKSHRLGTSLAKHQLVLPRVFCLMVCCFSRVAKTQLI
ncbi:zinc finger protein 69 homolog isoform X2 [Phascolarctos cinereus]|uniref:Zinc finger protein ZFP69-like isoform X1 n=2 Tax=Phascolarctos cinereus TaxID=38626 RepID=A0A6P5IHE2_PHACI|nr:zinc finger protein ZFP69-like isoform X1 [Phascolarctos cinereus]